MTPQDDQLLEALSHLSPIEPDLPRETRTRALCHAEIARRFPRRPAVEPRRGNSLLDLAALTGLGIYLLVVLVETGRLVP